MANVLINEDTMTDIADAIRSKKGVSTTYKPSDMPTAIESISGGGITPTGTINITTNGTHDVTNYASASVAVPQGSTPTGTKNISITQNGTTTEDVTNYASAQITVNVQGGGGLPNHINSVNTVTLDSTATNMLALSNLIIQSARITRETGHVYFISLVEKEAANYVSKQMITVTLIGTGANGGGCRYSNNAYSPTYVTTSYDCANEIGDKYMIIDMSF